MRALLSAASLHRGSSGTICQEGGKYSSPVTNTCAGRHPNDLSIDKQFRRLSLPPTLSSNPSLPAGVVVQNAPTRTVPAEGIHSGVMICRSQCQQSPMICTRRGCCLFLAYSIGRFGLAIFSFACVYVCVFICASGPVQPAAATSEKTGENCTWLPDACAICRRRADSLPEG